MGPGEMDSVGEAVSGGLAARAFEPGAGEADGLGNPVCLNCGAVLVGPYCHCCGQSGHVHRTLSAWWHDLAHGVLHLDGKIWRTLPLLVLWPGDLTRRYVDGERARFVSPLALFLFATFLMFAVFSMSGASLVGMGERSPQEVAAELRETERRLEALKAEQATNGDRTRDWALRKQIADLQQAREGLAATNSLVTGDGRLVDADFRTGWAPLDEGIAKANANPSLLLYKLQANAYKFSWALIPLSVPFLWLLFLHRARYRTEFRAYDHLVFVTYSMSFMSLLLIAIVALHSLGLGGAWLGWAIMLVPPVHIYRQLRGTYRLSRFGAAWRTVALLFFANITIGLFATLLLAIGVLG